jgi:hypothetical protein
MVRQAPSWIGEHRAVWRVALLGGLVAAMFGPWAFTSDGIGPTSQCAAPLVRLAGGRCVRLVSGASACAFIASGFGQMTWAWLCGGLDLPGRGREFAGVVALAGMGALLLLPVASTLLLVLLRERKRLPFFHRTLWLVAGLAALVLGLLLTRPGLGCTLWGPWLYVGVAAAAVTAELLAARTPSVAPSHPG